MIRTLVKFSVERRVSVLMATLSLILFGVISYQQLPVNLLPNLSYPTFTIQTQFDNAAPEEMEQLVTRPIEEAVGVLKNLQKIHSVSRAGISEVILEFQWGSNMDTLAMEIREKIDRLRLPREVKAPRVLRFDPALDPIMKMSLSGDLPLTKLRLYAEDNLKEAFERIEGLASAMVQGGEEEEIHINLHQGKLASLGIAPSSVRQALANANINRPGGALKNEQSELLVRTLNEFESLDDIRRVRINNPPAAAVLLKDVADVSWAAKDKTEISRFNGKEGVQIVIHKQGDANTIEVAERVRAGVAQLTELLPQELQLEIIFDQSQYISSAIAEVKQALVVGGLLATLILWLFLRSFQLTAILMTVVPVSVVITFIFMYRGDISLNIMSLGGLTLGIGMLVDCAIVVLESIHRHRRLGLDNRSAAIQGASQVGGAVTASVLTSIAVFLPIIFVDGIAGQLFRDQSITITFSLLASLLLAFTLIPMLASGNKVQVTKAPDTEHGAATTWYLNLLDQALRFKWLVIAVPVIALVLSFSLLKKIPTQLIPELSEGEFYFTVELPPGTALARTDAMIREMETQANELVGVEQVYSTIGSRTVSGGLGLNTKAENVAQINVSLTKGLSDPEEQAIIDHLRRAYTQLSGATIKLGRPAFFNLEPPLELHFYGKDLDELKAYTEKLLPDLAKIEGVKDLQLSLETGMPELKINFDRAKLAKLGLNINTLSQVLSTRIDGIVATQFQLPDRVVDIRLRNRIHDRNSISDVENLVIGRVNGRDIKLSAVAEIEAVRGPTAIDRVQQARSAIITGNLEGRSLSAVTEAIYQLTAKHTPPQGVQLAIDGQLKSLDASFKQLSFAIALAVFLVYLVMAASFEHLIHPFIILFSLPLALIGVIHGLYWCGYGISVIALIGFIFLIGIVVNNAIVLIDAINQLRRQGEAVLVAIKGACAQRLRPILMTTCTTILGLLPLALGQGDGAELRAPLAIVVSFGLAASTLLTLFIIPCLYALIPTSVLSDAAQKALDREIQQAQHQSGGELDPT